MCSKIVSRRIAACFSSEKPSFDARIATPSSHQSNQRPSRPAPALSVVVACADNSDSLDRCLASLEATCAGIETEIIVVSAVDGSVVTDCLKRYSGVSSISMPPDTLVPSLWSEGISVSTGAVVALTISQCSATPEWAQSLVKAISNGAAAAGGPLSLSPRASAFDSAIFFLRYSAFLSERSATSTAGIAGDNCAYSSEALDVGGWTRESGFWEIVVNKLLADRGKPILWVPEAKMEFGGAGSVSSNARRRFVHGKHFGASRRANRGESALRIALASPLVPFVLFARAARRAWPNRQYRRKLIRSVPAFAVLSASWALGEAVGAIGGGVAHRD